MTQAQHQVLAKLKEALSGSTPTTEVNVLGMKFVLSVLKPEGEEWASAHSAGQNIIAFASNLAKPQIAAAIVSIDDAPVEQLFPLGAEERDAFGDDKRRVRSWRREQMLEYISENFDMAMVQDLYDALMRVTATHRQAIRKIGGTTEGAPNF